MNNNTLSTSECSDFIAFLKTQSASDDISAMVAQEALASELPKVFLEDLQRFGCISGMV